MYSSGGGTDFVALVLAGLEWAIVPLILMALVWRGLVTLPGNYADKATRSSAQAGGLAGLVILGIYVLSQKNSVLSPQFIVPTYGFQLPPTLLGLVVGFALRFGTHVLGLALRAVHAPMGLPFLRFSNAALAMVHVAAGACALFSYVFVMAPHSRPPVVFGAMGLALGALLAQMFLPDRDEKSTG